VLRSNRCKPNEQEKFVDPCTTFELQHLPLQLLKFLTKLNMIAQLLNTFSSLFFALFISLFVSSIFYSLFCSTIDPTTRLKEKQQQLWIELGANTKRKANN